MLHRRDPPSNAAYGGEVTNRLAHATSPYLLQHADNPVHWQEWGSAAFAEARERDVPILLSVGYAACHWCHVMEHESFADSAVAELMNEQFVSIKVDREERPDIDNVYMDAARLITGRGGWPLNVITLPDGRAVYAGTYFPRESWMDILAQISAMYANEPHRLLAQADAVHEGVSELDVWPANADTERFERSTAVDTWEVWQRSIDKHWGGSAAAPKFPLPSGTDSLLNYAYFTGDKDAYAAVRLQLDMMAESGIYDHLGGGFARYSTDEQWHVPHFEKMLYDNALLLSTYSSAFRFFRNERYREVIMETAGFLLTDMAHPDGGFYSAIDADSEGVEGKYYVWTKDEIRSVLGEDAEIFCQYYGITEQGNWEHGSNILSKTYGTDAAPRSADGDAIDIINAARKILLAHRRQRIAPATDTKMVAAWNAMVLSALVDAAAATGDAHIREAALRNGCFFRDTFVKDGLLYRNFKHGGQLKTVGFLDDYAFTVQAFTKLYQLTNAEKWLQLADTLQESALKLFEGSGPMLFYTSSLHETLPSRTTEVTDNVIASSNSVMAHNLLAIGTSYNREDLIERSKEMLAAVSGGLAASSGYLSNWFSLYQYYTFGYASAVFTGQEAAEAYDRFGQSYHPGTLACRRDDNSSIPIFADKEVKGRTQIYVCIDKTCNAPAGSVSDAESALRERITF